MRIAHIDVSLGGAPFKAPIRRSGGANADWTRIVVEIHADDGLAGIGETPGGGSTAAPPVMRTSPTDTSSRRRRRPWAS